MKKSKFLTAIGDHIDKLSDVVRNGVLPYSTTYANQLDVHCRRTISTIRHDHMVSEGKRILTPPNFKWIFAKQRNLFSFQDAFLLQFKKLNRKLVPSNYPTAQAELFDHAGFVDGLPGIGATLPLISVGYVLKPFFQGIEGIFVTYIIKHKPVWVHRLDDADEQQAPITSILTPNDPTQNQRKSRIRRSDAGDSSAAGTA